jgi:hypothetical protein
MQLKGWVNSEQQSEKRRVTLHDAEDTNILTQLMQLNVLINTLYTSGIHKHKPHGDH